MSYRNIYSSKDKKYTCKLREYKENKRKIRGQIKPEIIIAYKNEYQKNPYKNNSLLKKLYIVHRASRQIWL